MSNGKVDAVKTGFSKCISNETRSVNAITASYVRSRTTGAVTNDSNFGSCQVSAELFVFARCATWKDNVFFAAA